MNIEEFREYCLRKRGTTEGFPFDETTLVFKVMGKIYAITDLGNEFSINLKCGPERAIELRETYPETVIPGYHMNKKHWNTILMNGAVPDKLILEWVDHSYSLVVCGLTKKQQENLKNLK